MLVFIWYIHYTYERLLWTSQYARQDFSLVEWLAGVGLQYRWVVEGQGHINRWLRPLWGLAAVGGPIPVIFFLWISSKKKKGKVKGEIFVWYVVSFEQYLNSSFSLTLLEPISNGMSFAFALVMSAMKWEYFLVFLVWAFRVLSGTDN